MWSYLPAISVVFIFNTFFIFPNIRLPDGSFEKKKTIRQNWTSRIFMLNISRLTKYAIFSNRVHRNIVELKVRPVSNSAHTHGASMEGGGGNVHGVFAFVYGRWHRLYVHIFIYASEQFRAIEKKKQQKPYGYRYFFPSG